MKKSSVLPVILIALGILLFGAPNSIAYQEYADAGFGGCDNCHGAFQDNRSYISLSDGTDWGADLMDVHNIMVNSDCDTCHEGTTNFPVFMNHSNGGVGFDPISCIGCHGRAEDRGTAQDCVDPGSPNSPCRDGAGLRQHHYNSSPDFAGAICLSCHDDTDPANFTPVSEDVKPPYYTPDPDPNHPDKPVDPCNPNGKEDFAGTARGLDNDGDLVYDSADCNISTTSPGDCNSDGTVDAGDISALVLEIFDGDGNLPADAPGGTFPGDPLGSDANEDGVVDAGDISCTVLLIFNGPGACE